MKWKCLHYENTWSGLYAVGKADTGQWVFIWDRRVEGLPEDIPEEYFYNKDYDEEFGAVLGTSNWGSIIPHLTKCFNRLWFEQGQEDEAKYLMGEFLEFFYERFREKGVQ